MRIWLARSLLVPLLGSANMKIPVSDALVAEFTAKLRSGEPTGKVFPARMSECDFTKAQRELIRQARSDRKAAQKNGKAGTLIPAEREKPTGVPTTATAVAPTNRQRKALSKLQRMLYLQSGRCFFCGELLSEQEASIEHLNPKSRGGTGSEDNEVVCHRSLNETFGSLGLKEKFAFVLRCGGFFKCP